MKECDIIRGSKHTLTPPTYLQGSKPPGSTPCSHMFFVDHTAGYVCMLAFALEVCTGMGMAGIPREIRGNGYRYRGNTAGIEQKLGGSHGYGIYYHGKSAAFIWRTWVRYIYPRLPVYNV